MKVQNDNMDTVPPNDNPEIYVIIAQLSPFGTILQHSTTSLE